MTVLFATHFSRPQTPRHEQPIARMRLCGNVPHERLMKEKNLEIERAPGFFYRGALHAVPVNHGGF